MLRLFDRTSGLRSVGLPLLPVVLACSASLVSLELFDYFILLSLATSYLISLVYMNLGLCKEKRWLVLWGITFLCLPPLSNILFWLLVIKNNK